MPAPSPCVIRADDLNAHADVDKLNACNARASSVLAAPLPCFTAGPFALPAQIFALHHLQIPSFHLDFIFFIFVCLC